VLKREPVVAMTIPRSSARPMVAMTRLTARSMLAMAVSILAVCGAARVEAQDAGVPMAPPVTTAGDFAPHVARSYRRPVEEVAAAVEATLRQLRFKLKKEGETFVTRRQRLRRQELAGVLGDPDAIDAAVRLLVTVPGNVAPARVFVTALVDARSIRQASRVAREGGIREFNPAGPGEWFFGALEARLGAGGAPLPADHRARAAVTTAMEGGPRCLARLRELAQPMQPEGARELKGWQSPAVLREERPDYPYRVMEAGQDGEVTLDLTVGEDGVPHAIRPSAGKNAGVPRELLMMSLGTAAAWRFRPARLDGCPVPVVVHLVMTYQLR